MINDWYSISKIVRYRTKGWQECMIDMACNCTVMHPPSVQAPTSGYVTGKYTPYQIQSYKLNRKNRKKGMIDWYGM